MRIGYLSTRTLDSETHPPRLSISPLIGPAYLLAKELPGLASSRNRMLHCGSFKLVSRRAPVKWYFLTPLLAQRTDALGASWRCLKRSEERSNVVGMFPKGSDLADDS
jgi:hypothetical protein